MRLKIILNEESELVCVLKQELGEESSENPLVPQYNKKQEEWWLIVEETHRSFNQYYLVLVSLIVGIECLGNFFMSRPQIMIQPAPSDFHHMPL